MNAAYGDAIGIAVESKPIGGVDGGRYHGGTPNQSVCQLCTGFSGKAAIPRG
jgi:hypothetical protein